MVENYHLVMEGDQTRTTFPSSGHVAWEASARGTDTEIAGLTVAEEFGGDLQNDLCHSEYQDEKT